MTFYDVYFADGTQERICVQAMTTEQFRRSKGGNNNTTLALKQIKKDFPNRKPVKIVRTFTNTTVWEL